MRSKASDGASSILSRGPGDPTQSSRLFLSTGVLSAPTNRNVPIPCAAWLAAPKTKAELELGEQHEVRARTLGQLERFAPPRGTEDVETIVSKLPPEIFSGLRLQLGDEDCARPLAAIPIWLRQAVA